MPESKESPKRESVGLPTPPVETVGGTGDWAEPLTPEETDALLKKVTDEVSKRRLEVPAVLALEMHKPVFGYVTGMGVVFAPFLAPIMGPESYRDLNRLFRERDNVERLITMIELAAQERKAGKAVAA